MKLVAADAIRWNGFFWGPANNELRQNDPPHARVVGANVCLWDHENHAIKFRRIVALAVA